MIRGVVAHFGHNDKGAAFAMIDADDGAAYYVASFILTDAGLESDLGKGDKVRIEPKVLRDGRLVVAKIERTTRAERSTKPPEPWVYGKIARYSPPRPERAGFGFIVSDDGQETYCAQRVLDGAGIDHVYVGLRVKFREVAHPRSGNRSAVRIEVVDG
ncbi:MAG: hypothetical protein U1E62_26610 [Alsobacter sp.]